MQRPYMTTFNRCPYYGDMDHPLLGCWEFLPRTIRGIEHGVQRLEDRFTDVSECRDDMMLGRRSIANGIFLVKYTLTDKDEVRE